MKHLTLNSILITLVVLTNAFFSSCSSSSTKVEDAKVNVEKAEDDLDQAKIDYNEEYAKFLKESDEKTAANDRSIALLKSQSMVMKSEAKAEYDRSIADLEKRNAALKLKVKENKNEDNTKWESFKREVNYDMEELGKAIQNLTQNNKK